MKCLKGMIDDGNFGRALHFAIIKDKIEILKYVLGNNSKRVTTAGEIIYLTFKYHKVNLLESLVNEVEINVNDDIKDKDFNALHAFSAEGDLEAVKWLLKKKADPNETDGYLDKRALHIACENGHIEIIKCLIEHGANPQIRSKKGLNALEILQNFVQANERQKQDCEEILKILVTKINDIRMRLSSDYEPILVNTFWSFDNHGNFKKCEFFKWDEDNFKEMVMACINASMPDLKLFLRLSEHDSVFNLKNNASDQDTGYRVLEFAVFKGHLDVVKYLLENGAQIEARDPWKITHNALDVAIEQGNEEMVELLIQHGANVEHKLYLAISKGQIKIAKLLLKGNGFNKPNIDALSENGFNPLHLSTKQNKIEVVTFLINNGADPNKKSGREGHGRAALHFAAETHNCEMIESFIDHFGADVFQKDTNGLTPLELVKRGIQTKKVRPFRIFCR